MFLHLITRSFLNITVRVALNRHRQLRSPDLPVCSCRLFSPRFSVMCSLTAGRRRNAGDDGKLWVARSSPRGGSLLPRPGRRAGEGRSSHELSRSTQIPALTGRSASRPSSSCCVPPRGPGPAPCSPPRPANDSLCL